MFLNNTYYASGRNPLPHGLGFHDLLGQSCSLLEMRKGWNGTKDMVTYHYCNMLYYFHFQFILNRPLPVPHFPIGLTSPSPIPSHGIYGLAFPYSTQSTSSLWRWNWYMVPKHRHVTYWRRGNTQKNIYNIQITAKAWNLQQSVLNLYLALLLLISDCIVI